MTDKSKLARVRLSSLNLNECGILRGCRFIVVDRYPADRVSGGTEVMFENGTREEFVWDRSDPLVTYLGPGKQQTKIAFPTSDHTTTIWHMQPNECGCVNGKRFLVVGFDDDPSDCDQLVVRVLFEDRYDEVVLNVADVKRAGLDGAVERLGIGRLRMTAEFHEEEA